MNKCIGWLALLNCFLWTGILCMVLSSSFHKEPTVLEWNNKIQKLEKNPAPNREKSLKFNTKSGEFILKTETDEDVKLDSKKDEKELLDVVGFFDEPFFSKYPEDMNKEMLYRSEDFWTEELTKVLTQVYPTKIRIKQGYSSFFQILYKHKETGEFIWAPLPIF